MPSLVGQRGPSSKVSITPSYRDRKARGSRKPSRAPSGGSALTHHALTSAGKRGQNQGPAGFWFACSLRPKGSTSTSSAVVSGIRPRHRRRLCWKHLDRRDLHLRGSEWDPRTLSASRRTNPYLNADLTTCYPSRTAIQPSAISSVV